MGSTKAELEDVLSELANATRNKSGVDGLLTLNDIEEVISSLSLEANNYAIVTGTSVVITLPQPINLLSSAIIVFSTNSTPCAAILENGETLASFPSGMSLGYDNTRYDMVATATSTAITSKVVYRKDSSILNTDHVCIACNL